MAASHWGYDNACAALKNSSRGASCISSSRWSTTAALAVLLLIAIRRTTRRPSRPSAGPCTGRCSSVGTWGCFRPPPRDVAAPRRGALFSKRAPSVSSTACCTSAFRSSSDLGASLDSITRHDAQPLEAPPCHAFVRTLTCAHPPRYRQRDARRWSYCKTQADRSDAAIRARRT